MCGRPGAPESMHVSPEQNQLIENGSTLVYTVDLVDKSGNPTTESNASVTCNVRYCFYRVFHGSVYVQGGTVKTAHFMRYHFFAAVSDIVRRFLRSYAASIWDY